MWEEGQEPPMQDMEPQVPCYCIAFQCSSFRSSFQGEIYGNWFLPYQASFFSPLKNEFYVSDTMFCNFYIHCLSESSQEAQRSVWESLVSGQPWPPCQASLLGLTLCHTGNIWSPLKTITTHNNGLRLGPPGLGESDSGVWSQGFKTLPKDGCQQAAWPENHVVSPC